jgi:hypothetical protein
MVKSQTKTAQKRLYGVYRNGVCPQAPDDGLQIWKVAVNTRRDQ